MGEEPFRYALVAIDIFSKFLHVVPLRTKSPDETADAIDKVLTEIGHPRSVMVDAGGEFDKNFRERLKYFGIQTYVSRTPVVFAERAIRTLKEQILIRQNALGDRDWTDYLGGVSRYDKNASRGSYKTK